MKTINRRTVLAGACAVPVAGLPAHGGVNRVEELLRTLKAAEQKATEASSNYELLANRHPDLAAGCEPIDMGIADPFGGQTARYELGIDHAFAHHSERLRDAYGECDEVEEALSALNKLRLRAHARLSENFADWVRRRKVCGLEAASRAIDAAWEEECDALDALIAYEPQSSAEAAAKDQVLLKLAMSDDDGWRRNAIKRAVLQMDT